MGLRTPRPGSMADEIRNANVIRLTRDGDRWCALIGPDLATGVAGFGFGPIGALFELLLKLARRGWPFDETWTAKD